MKKLFLIFTLVAAMLLSAATALAAVPSVMDDAKLLSNAERAKVVSALQEIDNKYNVRVGVVTVKSIGSQKPGDFANQLIDKAYNNGPNGNMVLLQVVDQRKWYISTDKKLKSVVVGNEGVEYMSKAFVPYLKKNDYAMGFARFFLNFKGEIVLTHNHTDQIIFKLLVTNHNVQIGKRNTDDTDKSGSLENSIILENQYISL